MPSRGIQLAAVTIGLLVSMNAAAQQCDAYFAFDGNLSDASGNGYDGRMFGREGAPATPQFVEGRTGQALALDGTSAMRAFVDLHHERCPQVSFSAWLRIDGPTIQGSHQILSSGPGRSGPGLRIDGASLTLNGTENGLTQRDAVRPESGWMFIAGVYDYTSSEYTLYWRNRSVSATLSQYLRPPEEVIWVGAMDARLTHAASNLVIDDLRIYGRALGADEVLALAGSSAPAGGSDATAPATALASGSGAWQGSSCSTHAQCPSGSYCGRDGQCHPDQHAPMQEAPRSSGISATTNPIEPGSTIGTPRDAPLSGSGSAPEGGSTRPPVGVSQLPEGFGDPDLASGPQGAPDLTYESEEAAQEAAEQRQAQAAADAEATRRAEADAETGADNSPPSGTPRPVGEARFTAVGGWAGETQRILDLETEFLQGIQWAQRNSRPCFIAIGSGDPYEPFPVSLDLDCGTAFLALFSSNARSVDLETSVIASIEVCTDRGARLRAIRVHGDRVNLDGTLEYVPASDQESFGNCEPWSPRILCPFDHVATGVVVHTSDDRGDSEAIVGLQLVCRAVGLR